MEKEVRRHQKIHLALAIAGGESIAAWAKKRRSPEHGVPLASDPKVRGEVEAKRPGPGHRPVVQRRHEAANGIVTLAERPRPSRFSSRRGGRSWPTRGPSPSSRIWSTAWRRSLLFITHSRQRKPRRLAWE